jgi:hypothetical protein
MPVAPVMIAPLAPLPPGPAIGPAPEYHPPHDSGGLFTNVELDLLGVHIKNRLNGTVFFPDGTTTNLHLPGAELDWTLSPRFELGYRLADNLGAFMFTYRFLNTDGTAVVPNFDSMGDGSLQSRLDMAAWCAPGDGFLRHVGDRRRRPGADEQSLLRGRAPRRARPMVSPRLGLRRLQQGGHVVHDRQRPPELWHLGVAE